MPLNIIVKGSRKKAGTVYWDDKRQHEPGMYSQRPDLRVKNMPEESARYWNRILEETKPDYK